MLTNCKHLWCVCVRARARVCSQPTHLTRLCVSSFLSASQTCKALSMNYSSGQDHIPCYKRLETYRENLHRTQTGQLLRFWRKTSLKTTGGNAITLLTYSGNKLLHSLVICLDSFSRTAIKNTTTSSKRGSDDPLASQCISGGSRGFNMLSLFSARSQNWNPSIPQTYCLKFPQCDVAYWFSIDQTTPVQLSNYGSTALR